MPAALKPSNTSLEHSGSSRCSSVATPVTSRALLAFYDECRYWADHVRRQREQGGGAVSEKAN